MSTYAEPHWARQPRDEGRFAPFESTETGVELLDRPHPGAEILENAEAVAELMRRVEAMSSRRVGAVANNPADARGLDVDDYAQEVTAVVVRALKEGRDIERLDPYIRRTVANVIDRKTAGSSQQQTNGSARRLLDKKAAALSNELGRSLSGAEYDELADTVRQEWPDQSHLPSRGFQHMRGPREFLLHEEEEEGVEVMNRHESREVGIHGSVVDSYVEPGSELDRALSYIDGVEVKRDPRAARRRLWNALAEGAGAPIITEPHLSWRDARDAREAIPDVEALRKAMDDWSMGINSRQTECLLAPWRGCDERDQEAALGVMRQRPEYAYEMWDSAIYLANRTIHQRKKTGGDAA